MYTYIYIYICVCVCVDTDKGIDTESLQLFMKRSNGAFAVMAIYTGVYFQNCDVLAPPEVGVNSIGLGLTQLRTRNRVNPDFGRR